MFKSLHLKLAAVALAAVPAISFAAVDLDAVEAAGTDIAAVGAAVFVLYVGIKVYKWVRRAL